MRQQAPQPLFAFADVIRDVAVEEQPRSRDADDSMFTPSKPAIVPPMKPARHVCGGCNEWVEEILHVTFDKKPLCLDCAERSGVRIAKGPLPPANSICRTCERLATVACAKCELILCTRCWTVHWFHHFYPPKRGKAAAC